MTPLHLVFVLLLGTMALHASDAAAGRNKYVRCIVTISDSVIVRGGSVTVSFMLHPVDGIHVNGDPTPDFSLTQKDKSIAADTLRFAVEAFTGHLDSEKPLNCVLSFSKNLPTGAHTLQGTLSYFFCSDEKGWCNHFDQPVTIHIRIRQ
jgi:hypothetical protein